jgi:hypothetical protein
MINEIPAFCGNLAADFRDVAEIRDFAKNLSAGTHSRRAAWSRGLHNADRSDPTPLMVGTPSRAIVHDIWSSISSSIA